MHIHLPQERISQLSSLVNRATEKLLRLDKFIQYRLLKPDSTIDQIKISRREWAWSKSKVDRFQQELKDIRLNIVTQMVLLNLYVIFCEINFSLSCLMIILNPERVHQSRIGLTIDEICVISGQIQVNQHQSRNATNQQLNEHTRLLTDILDKQSRGNDLLQLTSLSPVHEPSILTKEGRARSSSSVIRIRAHTPHHQTSHCNPHYKCTYHSTWTFQSPNLLQQIMGRMFIGYSGYPIYTGVRRCTEVDCLAQKRFFTSVYYQFPGWFLEKAVTISVISICDTIRASLTIRRILPNNAEIFRLVRLGDITGLKRLFSMGLASPNDSRPDGLTALHVGGSFC